MPGELPPSQNNSFSPDQFSDASWELLDRNPVSYSYYDPNFYYDPSHTRVRPPHLNARNFASAQAGGYYAEPTGIQSALGRVNLGPKKGTSSNYTPSAGSEATDITLRVDNTVVDNAPRPTTPGPAIAVNVAYWATRNYDGSAQPLTERAMRALDCETSASRQNNPVDRWLEGRPYSYQQPNFAEPDASAKRSYRAGSHTTYETGLSWTVVSWHSHLERTDENVCAAGYQFDDVSYPHPAQALDIDEGSGE